MTDLNLLRSQGWLTCHQIMEKYGESNPALMKKVIKEKTSEPCEDCKIILRRKTGDNDYIYSPFLVSKIRDSFFLEEFNFNESRKENLQASDCYTAKELAVKFRTKQPCLILYATEQGFGKAGLIKETKKGFLIHKSLYFKLESHFLSNKRYG